MICSVETPCPLWLFSFQLQQVRCRNNFSQLALSQPHKRLMNFLPSTVGRNSPSTSDARGREKFRRRIVNPINRVGSICRSFENLCLRGYRRYSFSIQQSTRHASLPTSTLSRMSGAIFSSGH